MTFADKAQVEAFLFREAHLMDENAYDEWLALWASELLYWIPCNRDDSDPMREVSVVYDDRARLEGRIDRLKSGAAYAQDPKSRMRRLISNVEVEETGDEIAVASNFLLIELRRGREQLLGGRTIHKLRRDADGFKMHYKKVILVDNDRAIENLTFLI